MRKTAVFAAVVFAALAAYEIVAASRAHMLLGDFRAFYCAGSAVLHGRDPYAAASLYACERASAPFGLYGSPANLAVPAPLPGYALLLFVPLAALPYLGASVLWTIVLAAACGACVAALSHLVGRSVAAIVPVLAPALAIVALPYGQLAAIEMLALLVLALAARAQRWNVAACAAAAAAVLPHVALPALAAAAVFCRPMRWRIAAVCALLVGLDVAAGGAGVAHEYFSAVLPAHALSEIARTSQYGLSWVLYALGSGERPALIAGQISYVLMALAGIAAAVRLAKQRADAAYAVLIPPAFAVFGGTFIHYTEIVAALPAALLLYSGSRERFKPVFLTAAVLLALPWPLALNQPQLAAVFAVAGAAIACAYGRLPVRTAMFAGLACALAAAGIVYAGNHFGTGLGSQGTGAPLDASLAQASWAHYVRAHWSGTGPVWWIAKAPTWLGLLLLTVGCANAVAKKDFVLRVVIEHSPAAS
ncbi:MAG TPA: glycosyltransferase 87 family protein [Candidatus Baltobacteraceae bacterium]|nr:glycosyltransferase 87 family protein [Candidatus Baltobacteraceae bacterium]